MQTEQWFYAQSLAILYSACRAGSWRTRSPRCALHTTQNQMRTAAARRSKLSRYQTTLQQQLPLPPTTNYQQQAIWPAGPRLYLLYAGICQSLRQCRGRGWLISSREALCTTTVRKYIMRQHASVPTTSRSDHHLLANARQRGNVVDHNLLRFVIPNTETHKYL